MLAAALVQSLAMSQVCPKYGESSLLIHSPFFLNLAKHHCADVKNIEYHEGCGTQLPLKDASVDIVLVMYVLSHLIPEKQEELVREARRVLRPGGRLVLEDKDLASWSLTFGPTDPLSACVETMLEAWDKNLYVCRTFPAMLAEAGLEPETLKFHHDLYDEEDSYGYKYVLVRAINLHIKAGRCTAELGETMLQEAKQRVKDKIFQCLITYAFCIGTVPVDRSCEAFSST